MFLDNNNRSLLYYQNGIRPILNGVPTGRGRWMSNRASHPTDLEVRPWLHIYLVSRHQHAHTHLQPIQDMQTYVHVQISRWYICWDTFAVQLAHTQTKWHTHAKLHISVHRHTHTCTRSRAYPYARTLKDMYINSFNNYFSLQMLLTVYSIRNEHVCRLCIIMFFFLIDNMPEIGIYLSVELYKLGRLC